jgi:hypothetical protein
MKIHNHKHSVLERTAGRRQEDNFAEMSDNIPERQHWDTLLTELSIGHNEVVQLKLGQFPTRH